MMERLLSLRLPGFSASQFVHLGILHAVVGVISIALQIAVYICVIQYDGNVYLTSGNLVFPLFSFGIFCAFTYFWTALLSIKLANQLRIIAATRVSYQTVARFRKLNFASIILSCLLLMTSAYLISVTAFWYTHHQQQLYRYESLTGLASTGKAAMVIHILHLILAFLEIILSIMGLMATPKPPLKILLAYQAHRFTADTLQRSGGLLTHRAPGLAVNVASSSMQTLQTLPSAHSTTSMVSDF